MSENHRRKCQEERNVGFGFGFQINPCCKGIKRGAKESRSHFHKNLETLTLWSSMFPFVRTIFKPSGVSSCWSPFLLQIKTFQLGTNPFMFHTASQLVSLSRRSSTFDHCTAAIRYHHFLSGNIGAGTSGVALEFLNLQSFGFLVVVITC